MFGQVYKKMFITGLGNIAVSFGKYGFPIPAVLGTHIAGIELVGGILLLIGLFGRWLGLLYAAEFVVAAFWVPRSSAAALNAPPAACPRSARRGEA